MVPSDMPAVNALLAEQNARDGTSYGIPTVFDSNGVRLSFIPLALVAVNVDTGEVVQGHIFERTLEQMSFGISSRATSCSIREQEAVFFLLRERGYRDVHILVPEKRARQMESGLRRFLKMSATGLRHFYRRLDTEENRTTQKWYEELEK